MILLLIVLVLLCSVGGAPQWGWHSYGYAPTSIGAILVVILVILLLTGRL